MNKCYRSISVLLSFNMPEQINKSKYFIAYIISFTFNSRGVIEKFSDSSHQKSKNHTWFKCDLPLNIMSLCTSGSLPGQLLFKNLSLKLLFQTLNLLSKETSSSVSNWLSFIRGSTEHKSWETSCKPATKQQLSVEEITIPPEPCLLNIHGGLHHEFIPQWMNSLSQTGSAAHWHHLEGGISKIWIKVCFCFVYFNFYEQFRRVALMARHAVLQHEITWKCSFSFVHFLFCNLFRILTISLGITVLTAKSFT